MPLYTVTTKHSLSEPVQQEIVNHITDVHCQLTGAPEIFVQVMFSYGVGLGKNTDAHFSGGIRSGRSGELKTQLAEQMTSGIARVLGSDKKRIQVVLMDVPAKWALEGGDIMPEPGEEEQWLKDRNLETVPLAVN